MGGLGVAQEVFVALGCSPPLPLPNHPSVSAPVGVHAGVGLHVPGVVT